MTSSYFTTLECYTVLHSFNKRFNKVRYKTLSIRVLTSVLTRSVLTSVLTVTGFSIYDALDRWYTAYMNMLKGQRWRPPYLLRCLLLRSAARDMRLRTVIINTQHYSYNLVFLNKNLLIYFPTCCKKVRQQGLLPLEPLSLYALLYQEIGTCCKKVS